MVDQNRVDLTGGMIQPERFKKLWVISIAVRRALPSPGAAGEGHASPEVRMAQAIGKA